jgi:uncharacterized membrane protein YeaQ/YmgE (transglycosylase-associated protein family)
MVLADIPDIHLVPNSGPMDLIFHQTWLEVSIVNIPPNGYRLTLIGLIIIVLLALLVNAITERLTSRKMGGLFTAVLVTIVGSVLTAAYVQLPFDFAIEGVRIIAALLGAVIIAVFLVLLRGAASSKN